MIMWLFVYIWKICEFHSNPYVYCANFGSPYHLIFFHNIILVIHLKHQNQNPLILSHLLESLDIPAGWLGLTQCTVKGLWCGGGGVATGTITNISFHSVPLLLEDNRQMWTRELVFLSMYKNTPRGYISVLSSCFHCSNH